MECENYCHVARKYNISDSTVRNIVKSHMEKEQKLSKIKEQSVLDILDYLDSQAQSYKNFTDYLINERLDPVSAKEALDKLSVSQLVSIFRILTDKFIKSKEIRLKTKTEYKIEKINKNLLSLAEIIKAPKPAHKIKVDENE